MSKFKTGDRVTVIGGDNGVIVDCLTSSLRKIPLYEVEFKDNGYGFYEEDELEQAKPKETYRVEFDYAENVVVARLYKDVEGNSEFVARGHGHIIHDGVLGYAQAASYALKRIYESLENKE